MNPPMMSFRGKEAGAYASLTNSMGGAVSAIFSALDTFAPPNLAASSSNLLWALFISYLLIPI